MIDVRNLSITAGDFRLADVSFTVPTGAYGMLMGRTGCGKTTILECVLGLRTMAGGRIRIDSEDVTHLNPSVRGIGYVPQDGALFRNMSVRDNLAFALLIRHSSKKQIDDRVDELASVLGISHLLDRRPHGLSGGEAQRVALGRALSFRPRVLCLDEPLAALDSDTRGQMYELLESIREKTRVTTLHVTHNNEEADRLADCLFRLNGGKIEILKSPAELST